MSGRDSRRVIHAALNGQTGQLVRVLRERHRQDDAIALLEARGEVAPSVPKLLIWDNAPPPHPKRVLQAASSRGIDMAFLPSRLVCEVVEAHPAGDHTLYIGHVKYLDYRGGSPLLYYTGRYA
ncbi:MAG: flavin reductase family protein, partial [Ktedonobacteraceae bacterium]|nr:flavin reductase family protein [Ktedonobacteraceae bacterium]